MMRAYRSLIIGLLLLTQLVAPLVHAHAGGNRSAGLLHVPGLEFLATQGDVNLQIPGERLSPELIVALSPGLKAAMDLAVPSADPPQALPPGAALQVRAEHPSGSTHPFRRQAFCPLRAFAQASPRAPPTPL